MWPRRTATVAASGIRLRIRLHPVAGRDELIGAYLSIQRPQREAQTAGRTLAMPAFLFQHLQDLTAFDVLERRGRRPVRRYAIRPRESQQLRRKVGELDDG